MVVKISLFFCCYLNQFMYNFRVAKVIEDVNEDINSNEIPVRDSEDDVEILEDICSLVQF